MRQSGLGFTDNAIKQVKKLLARNQRDGMDCGSLWQTAVVPVFLQVDFDNEQRPNDKLLELEG